MIVDSIIIKGARQNNLKNIDVVIPRNKLVVIIGISGSSKFKYFSIFKWLAKYLSNRN
ncbi:UvrABC system protein A [subsurface metagenome]